MVARHHFKPHPHPPHPHNRTEMSDDVEVEYSEEMPRKHKKRDHGRKLRFEEFLGGDCHSVTAQDSCDAISGCSWCKSAAVKSSCKTIDEAKSLPSAVFACDKLDDEEEEDMYDQEEEEI